MSNLKSGDELINQISQVALLYTDKELIKHFNLDAAKVFRKCADRIEEVFGRIKDESKKKTK